ncbi:unnamed protein product [Ectocarpus sp. 12 AP-2014]
MNPYVATTRTRLHRTTLLNAKNVLRKTSVTQECDTSSRRNRTLPQKRDTQGISFKGRKAPSQPALERRTCHRNNDLLSTPAPKAATNRTSFSRQWRRTARSALSSYHDPGAGAKVPSSRLRAATKLSCLPLVARGRIIT